MYFKYCLVILFLVRAGKADSDGKRWVWADGRRRVDDRYYTGLVNGDRKYTGDLVGPSKPLFQPSSGFVGVIQSNNDKLRYEVTEPPYTDTVRPERPIVRPIGTYQPGPDFNRPDFNRPDYNRPDYNRPGNNRPDQRPGNNNYKPIRPIENEYRPVSNGLQPPPANGFKPGGYRPVTGQNGRPILTGPVPSWEQQNEHRYKDYDKCKCVHSFNCNTPGIKFGSCDVDKQYCCYKSKDYDGFNAGRPRPRPTYEKPRPVLAGPGGPVDGPNRPQYSGHRDRPFRPFSDIDRYVDVDRDLDDAYRKGLESAIFELRDRPYLKESQSLREFNYQDPYRPAKQPMKYGLYEPVPAFYARSGNSSILADLTQPELQDRKRQKPPLRINISH